MISNVITDKIQHGKNWFNEKLSDAFEVVAKPIALIGLGFFGMTAARLAFSMAESGNVGGNTAWMIALAGTCAFSAQHLKKEGVKGSEILVPAGAVASFATLAI